METAPPSGTLTRLLGGLFPVMMNESDGINRNEPTRKYTISSIVLEREGSNEVTAVELEACGPAAN